MLSRSEELAIARQIAKTRGRLRRALLSSDFILQTVVAALDEVLSGKLRWDRVIELSDSDPRKGQITHFLETKRRTLARLIRSNRNDFRIAVGHRKHSPDEQGRKMAADPLPSKGGALIEQVAVRMPRLQSALDALKQISQRMTAIGGQGAGSRKQEAGRPGAETGTIPIYRNGPEGASHKWVMSPSRTSLQSAGSARKCAA